MFADGIFNTAMQKWNDQTWNKPQYCSRPYTKFNSILELFDCNAATIARIVWFRLQTWVILLAIAEPYFKNIRVLFQSDWLFYKQTAYLHPL